MTPVRAALRSGSALARHVQDGLSAFAQQHAHLIDSTIRSEFGDSLDLDAALKADHPEDPRWDYLVGHAGTDSMLGVEPHSARDAEITRVIAKRRHAIQQLKPHLRTEARVASWFWVASGRVDFLVIEKARLQLSQAGITFVGRVLRAKDLPAGQRKRRRKA